MEPRIRYAKTADDISIAFWAMGEGPPLVHTPWLPWGHVLMEWRNPELHLWYSRLAAESHLVRYDGRGSGLSDWDAKSYGLEAQICDLEAVVDRLNLERFSLLGVLNMGPAVIAYAARHPERVSHLILWCTYASHADYYSSPHVQAIRTILERDWQLYTETGAHSFIGWSAGEAAHELAQVMRDSSSPEIARQFFKEMHAVDCTHLLPDLPVPTLVIQPRQFPLIGVDKARRLVAAIPDARLDLFEGSSLAPTRLDLDAVVGRIIEFITETGADRPALVDETRGDIESVESNGLPSGLTQREVEVLAMLAKGMSNREMADTLVLSARTVERHVANIYAKINAKGRAQATAFAISHGLL